MNKRQWDRLTNVEKTAYYFSKWTDVQAQTRWWNNFNDAFETFRLTLPF